MTTAEDIERLLKATRKAYDVVFEHLPGWRAHCYEVSRLAYIIGHAMGLSCRLCRGSRLLPNNVADRHGWLRIGDVVLHSPRRGEVELVPWSEAFREEWAAGA